jgi:pimeloyl-ACP methyl ester carboxylesterase
VIPVFIDLLINLPLAFPGACKVLNNYGQEDIIMSYFLTDDAVKLFYDVCGKGEKTIILIHGGSASSRYYRKQVPELSKRYKVVTYDLRGHGASEIPDHGYNLRRMGQDLKNLIDFLQPGNVYIIGWSLGTAIMFSYIEQFGQDRLGGLIVVDMTAKVLTDENCKLGLYGNFTIEDSLNAIISINEGWDKLVPDLASAFFCDIDKCKDDFEWVVNEELKNSESIMVRIWTQFPTIDQRHMLHQISVPTLITYGGAEKLYKKESSEYLHQSIRDSRLLRFENASHALFLEQADQFNKAVSEFIG